jgi:hypothetical protein
VTEFTKFVAFCYAKVASRDAKFAAHLSALHFSTFLFGNLESHRQENDGQEDTEQPATNDSKTERKKKFRWDSKILCILFIHVQVVCESKCKFIAWRVVEAVGRSRPEQG